MNEFRSPLALQGCTNDSTMHYVLRNCGRYTTQGMHDESCSYALLIVAFVNILVQYKELRKYKNTDSL